MSSTHDEPHIFDQMRDRRIIFVRDPLDAEEANRVIAELLHMEGRSPLDEILMRINCTHADAQAALAVYDTMQSVLGPVGTLCAGAASGGAALLVAAGVPGRRAALPSAQFYLQQQGGRLTGRPTEIEAASRRLQALQNQLNELLAKHSGQPLARVEDDTSRRLALNAEEARAYGLIDHIGGPPNPAGGGVQ